MQRTDRTTARRPPRAVFVGSLALALELRLRRYAERHGARVAPRAA